MQPESDIRIRETADNMVCVEAFAPALKESRLLDFDRVMALKEVRTIKHAVPERRTGTFSFAYQGKICNAFIKRHFPPSFKRFIRERIRLASAKTAFDEFYNILAFLKAGIPTMTPIAAGRRKRGLWGAESFLMTRAIEGCITLETFAETRWKQTVFSDKKRLILKMAQLTRKMHDCGFNHRDYYLCHLLIGIEAWNKEDVFVVDLHRVDIRKRVPQRWIVKDLAALYYSSLSFRISRTEKLRFFKYYLGSGKLSAQDRALLLNVFRKSRKMMSHAR